MTSLKAAVFLFLLFFTKTISSQTLNGFVYDSETKKPLKSASVYFNNTTIGVLTNDKGYFEITNKKGLNSPLVISHLSYENQLFSLSKIKKTQTYYLKKAITSLKEVVIHRNDPFTRAQKLKMFKKGFLGSFEYAKYCKIINENDLILKYHQDANEGELIVYSKNPLQIENNFLGYTIHYDLIEYSEIRKGFQNSTVYYGTTLFKNKKPLKRKYIKNRKKIYKGSVLHFIKSLYQNQLDENNFNVIKNGFVVKNKEYINIKKSTKNTVVSFKEDTLRIIHTLNKKHNQSIILLKTDSLTIDKYLNYDPRLILFGGALGKEKISLMLPLDFNTN